MKNLLFAFLVIALPLDALGSSPADPMASESTSAVIKGGGNEDDVFMGDEGGEVIVNDPLEPLNRGIFWFNDKLYLYLMKPVARAYRFVPEGARVSVQNFFSNMAAPVRFINAGLQGKFADAGNELIRFVTNTTLGIAGFFDPAREHFGIREKDEDTGQTLGHYGVGHGLYLVLPVLGPSNARDAIGLFADSRMDLVYYAWENRDYYGAKAFDAINALSLDKDTYEGIKRDTLDPYLFTRDAYMQYRKGKIEK